LGGEITSFNRTAEEITGLRFYDVQGKPWWEVLGAEDLKHLFEADQPIKEPVRFDRTFFRNDGNRLLLGLTVSPLKNEEGIQIGSVWTFQNLTRIREMEEEIENKKRLATIGEMAAGMAHEIRNPLAALSGSIQVLHKGKKLEGREAKQLMSIALKETNRLDSIIKSFLLYARPAPLNKKPTDINRLIKETVNLMENSRDFPEKIRIRLDLNPGRLNVTIDPDRIRQVLWNLSNNAVEAMPDGGVLSVTTRSPSSGTDNKNPDPKWVEILFSDSGQGIEEEHLKKIFFPFFTTKDHGSGLGLPIVYRIMEEHRGRIHVTSQAQKGTQIMLLLPLAGEEVSAVPTH
ncbi:MAG TPA: ATP-binding protein, partial [Nitrospiria bacterium]|nr:ATP-binding protein [Nitrospiria bacterium]